MKIRSLAALAVLLFVQLGAAANAASVAARPVVVTLTRENAAAYAPQGRESDWIYGDLVLRNEHLTAVIGRPVAGRNANWVIQRVGCALIDLTETGDSNDLLGVFRPGGEDFEFQAAKGQLLNLSGKQTPDGVPRFRCVSPAKPGRPELMLEYRLVGAALEVETLYANRSDVPVEIEAHDVLRAEETFQKAGDAKGRGESDFFWAYDRFAGQAYGVTVEVGTIRFQSDWRSSTLDYQLGEASVVRLAPGQGYRLTRRLRAASDLLELRAQVQRARGAPLHELELRVSDPRGPVPAMDVAVFEQAGGRVGLGRTDASGVLALALGPGRYRLRTSGLGRGSRDTPLALPGPASLAVEMPAPSVVEAEIRDGVGAPIAAKLQFIGVAGTATPDFGPAQGTHALRNLYYSHDGRVRAPLPPGRYRVVASHGPEYDAFQDLIELKPGETVTLEVQLPRSVDTTGWISADMHGHSTDSGDTSASKRGRVLNLLAEHIEFAPATEHNRTSSYEPQLRALGAQAQMATAAGVELTGQIPMNHQNAFPLRERARRQDGGAPLPGDPVAQIRRLSLFEGEREKLVQQNHPDLLQILQDRDRDGVADGGYRGMLPYIDVMEIYPLARFLNQEHDDERDSPMLLWLALQNRGVRIPAVINTDAHSNFHGSGPRRTWIRSRRDEPAEIDVLELVRELKQGHAVMSSGPFLEVTMQSADGQTAIPGDDLVAPGGAVEVSVRVQCPNWFDIDRVQLLLNGRVVPELNFSRASAPERFSEANLRFASVIPLSLEQDTHVVVLAAGQGSQLGVVMGRQNAGITPIAVSNPIFVDVDGNGFEPSYDSLGVEWPSGSVWPSEPSPSFEAD